MPDLATTPRQHLPANEEAEAALIARLLADPGQVAVVSGTLGFEDFYVAEWRRAYAAMQRLSQEHKRIDILTLSDALGDRNGELSDRMGMIQHYRAPIDEYVAIIKREAFRRRMISSLGSVVNRAHVEEDIDKLLSEMHDAIVEVSTGIDDEMLVSPTQAAEAYFKVLEDRQGDAPPGLLYGFDALDRILNPAMGGEMIVLAARPSVGKTALAEMIADHWSQQSEHPILYVSLEMSVTKLLNRTVSRYSDLPARQLVVGKLRQADYELARSTADQRRAVRLWYLDDGFATTSSVRSAAAKVRIAAGGIGGIVIDYLQLLSDNGDQEVQRVTKMSRKVKGIAREFNVPVLTLSQLNRSLESREDKHPKLYDLRESGAIEQDADVVLGLYRPLDQDYTDIEVLKQRDGMVGMVHLTFDGEHVRFADLPPMVTKDQQTEAWEA